MFETDLEYLRKAEERFKRNGLQIVDKNTLLKNHHKNLKSLFIISIVVTAIYLFVIGFAFGRG